MKVDRGVFLWDLHGGRWSDGEFLGQGEDGGSGAGRELSSWVVVSGGTGVWVYFSIFLLRRLTVLKVVDFQFQETQRAFLIGIFALKNPIALIRTA